MRPAINAWYALVLLGTVLSNAPDLDFRPVGETLTSVGSLLLTTDLQAYHYYVHVLANYSNPIVPQVMKVCPSTFSFRRLGTHRGGQGGRGVEREGACEDVVCELTTVH